MNLRLLVLCVIGTVVACDDERVTPVYIDASAPAPPPAPSGPAPVADCSAGIESVRDVVVPASDLLVYPPYALSGCRLAYVSASGDLRQRDLTTGTETVLAPASEQPAHPTIAQDLVAWESTIDSRTRLRVLAGGNVVDSPASFAYANEGKATDGAVVFTAWKSAPPGGDADVWIFEGGKFREVLGGAAQQRFADVDAKWVAVSDFSEDPDGQFDGDEHDLADIVLVARDGSGVVRRAQPGKQAFPMLVDDSHIGYLDWGAIHPEPKLEAFNIKVGDQVASTSGDRMIATVKNPGRPSLPIGRGGLFEWVGNTDTSRAIFRAPADGSGPAIPTPRTDVALSVPAASRSLTVFAGAITAGSSSAPLRAIAR